MLGRRFITGCISAFISITLRSSLAFRPSFGRILSCVASRSFCPAIRSSSLILILSSCCRKMCLTWVGLRSFYEDLILSLQSSTNSSFCLSFSKRFDHLYSPRDWPSSKFSLANPVQE